MDRVPIWLETARLWEGVEATPGAASTPSILGLYAACGHPEIRSDDVAWCAAWMGGTLADCGLRNTGSLLASSYADFGVGLDEPVVGAIAVLDGHVAYVDEVQKDHVILLGGNQGKSEGRSAVTRARYRKSSVLSYRWPVPLQSPKDLDAAGSRSTQKGKADIVTGSMLLALGGGAVANNASDALATAAVSAASSVDTDKLLSLIDKGAKVADALVSIGAKNPLAIILLLVGAYLIASGALLRLWRTEDANNGHNLSRVLPAPGGQNA